MRKIEFILLSLNLLSGPVFAMQMHSSDGCEFLRENSGYSDNQYEYSFDYNQSNQYNIANEGRLTGLSVCEHKMRDVVSSCCMTNLTKESLHQNSNKVVLGGIIQGDTSKKQIALVFTGHQFADGGEAICNTLKHQKVKGSFFLTGDFYRTYPKLVKHLQKGGHYLGPHSDKHILYADWTKRDSTLVSREAFRKDLTDNYQAMINAGIKLPEFRYFLPSYEWYNSDISSWCTEMGVQLVNFTPGTTSNADYTLPQMKNYRSSEEIYNNIMIYEQVHSLNGFMLLIHIGTDPGRSDKLYNKLDQIINHLKALGYEFVSVDKLL
ncbi:polysaccharide deacetylase family protein [uncultured Bacteroides sp.]|uniref:polysaccharide deacetylase family protein n=1 Tax=uncultured Bacteroides sp. TaxID=162156 RepID=UPI002AA61294|nr:polysaccharide deacetylase family protein [uncultured Bacteroides sp.]